ncbi:MAG TPA: hypothetical protein ENF87_00495 [Thermoproteales archaeon]|nr:hypothetical protein [Thermoproteales archaeon]
MPILIEVGSKNKTIIYDYFSTIFFKQHFIELLDLLKEKYDKLFPTLLKLFETKDFIKPEPIIEEALDLLTLVWHENRRLPRYYFFAVFPIDYSDVASLLLGGASSMEFPSENIRLQGGLGKALMRKGSEIIKMLKDGDEINVGNTRIKVFTKPCYYSVEKPLKTLITYSLLASRKRVQVRLLNTGFVNLELKRL